MKYTFKKNKIIKKSYGPSSDACSSNMVSSLTAAASVVLLISSATRASSFLNIKEKQFTDKKTASLQNVHRTHYLIPAVNN